MMKGAEHELIVTAETPLPLSSCRLANITASSLSLTCQRPDVDAIGTTHYRAEVGDATTPSLLT